MTAAQLDISLSAMCAAATVGLFARLCAHPLRSPRSRMALYLDVPRAQLGAPARSGPGPLVASEALRRVLGPVAVSGLALLDRVVRLGPPEGLEVSLRRAGMAMSADEYRREHLRWAVAMPLMLGGLGALSGRATYVVIFFLAGVLAGARRMPERVKAATRRRNDRTRSDLPAVAAVLALKIDNNKSLAVAVPELVSQGTGPVIEDLTRAVHLVNAGYGEVSAFELLACETGEPAAGRFYRFLAAACSGGLDLARALLDQANELRAQRREEVERSAARRQMSLVVPNLVFMAPVLFVFLLAPLPQLLFGK
ncbi:MAG TPA: type II secretion system F family protein [Acidimicrobiales bacterium]|nr:type II secretion system F family protein [Acidimicrobiales bacterium]